VRVCPAFAIAQEDAARQFNVEYRVAEAAASPSMVLGALVHAGVDGIRHRMPLPPVKPNFWAMSEADRTAAGTARLPASLSEALDRLAVSEVAHGWFGDDFLAVYLQYKRSESTALAGADLAEVCRRYVAVYGGAHVSERHVQNNDATALKRGVSEEHRMSKTFVLIHGSWHGGWAWHAVMRSLAEQGYRAHAPTLPGHGPARRLGITHQDCVDAVVAYMQQHELEDVILVGHSFGGSVIQKVAEQLPNRIGRMVFLDALVLTDNQCVCDTLPAEYVALFNALAGASADNTMLIPWDIWRDHFIQDAPASVARAIWEHLSPEPHQVNVDTLDLKRFSSLTMPKSFIYCRQDKALPPGSFHPGMSSRLGACKLLEMDGSHEVLLTRPAAVAGKLIEASSD
jgi:pimeloyl-ACP methyl ester carboxylesterase